MNVSSPRFHDAAQPVTARENAGGPRRRDPAIFVSWGQCYRRALPGRATGEAHKPLSILVTSSEP